MATKTVTTSLVVEFDTKDGEGHLSLEIDSREDGLNKGDTTFYPGDSPGILMFRSSNVVIDKIVVSEGSLSSMGSAIIDTEEWLSFANEKSASPKYPVSSGAVTDTGGIQGDPVVSELAVTFPTPQIGVAFLKYSSLAQLFKLFGAPGDKPVVVYVSGHTVKT